MIKIGDRFKPKGRTFSTIIYEVTAKEYSPCKNETLYWLELIVPPTGHIIYDLSEDALTENYIKIN